LKIILHIGTEKTGTTSIQKFLNTNKRLLSKNGVVSASEFFLKNVSNNFELVLASNPDPGNLLRFRKSEFQLFRHDIKSRIAELVTVSDRTGKGTVVFSSEHMSSRLVDVSHIEALKLLFPATCDITIIIYLRRQDELFLGSMAEAIKQGRKNLKFVDPLRRIDDNPYGHRYYNYNLLLSRWAEVFGKGNIIVRPFERSQLRGRDITEDFYTFVSHDSSFSDYKKVPKANQRLSAQALYIMSRLNLLGMHRPDTIAQKVSQLDDFTLSSLVPESVLADFFRQFEVSNRQVAEEYLKQSELFTEQAKYYEYFDPEDVEQALEAMSKLLLKCLFK